MLRWIEIPSVKKTVNIFSIYSIQISACWIFQDANGYGFH